MVLVVYIYHLIQAHWAQQQMLPVSWDRLINQAVWHIYLLSPYCFLNLLFDLSKSTESHRRSVVITMIDSAAVAAEVGFHKWSLFLALFSATSARSPVHIRLDHQRLLPLLLLLLFKERSLSWRFYVANVNAHKDTHKVQWKKTFSH